MSLTASGMSRNAKVFPFSGGARRVPKSRRPMFLGTESVLVQLPYFAITYTPGSKDSLSPDFRPIFVAPALPIQ
jgi:hypothetical protein